MQLFARFLCLIGQHRRSRGHARRGDTGWQSRCRGCGVRMEKRDGDAWRLAPPTAVVTPKPQAETPGKAVARDRKPEPAPSIFSTASARMQRFVKRF